MFLFPKPSSNFANQTSKHQVFEARLLDDVPTFLLEFHNSVGLSGFGPRGLSPDKRVSTICSAFGACLTWLLGWFRVIPEVGVVVMETPEWIPVWLPVWVLLWF